MTTMNLKITGMHCGACAIGIQTITSGLDGVKSSAVDYDKKTGVIEFDETKIKKDDIFKAIKELGYEATE